MTVEQMKERIYSGIRKEMLHGVQAIRTHIDVTDPTFTGLKAALEVRDEVKDILDLQIVAFPQEGMYAYKDGDKLVEEGLKMGADCVGAIPHFELAREFGEKSIHKTIELAVKYNKLIDDSKKLENRLNDTGYNIDFSFSNSDYAYMVLVDPNNHIVNNLTTDQNLSMYVADEFYNGESFSSDSILSNDGIVYSPYEKEENVKTLN